MIMEISFSIPTMYGNYNDSLFFPDDAVPSEQEIERLKQERVEKWLLNFSAGSVDAYPDSPRPAQQRVHLALGGSASSLPGGQ